MVERYLLVFGGLLAGGIGYNWLVARLEERHPDHPYTAFLVAAGVAATLAFAAVLVGIQAVLLVLTCFVASGLPMALGSMQRYLSQRSIERTANMMDVLEQLRALADDD